MKTEATPTSAPEPRSSLQVYPQDLKRFRILVLQFDLDSNPDAFHLAVEALEQKLHELKGAA